MQVLNRLRKQIGRDEAGATSVEYALTLPVLFLLTFFLIVVAWYWYNQIWTAVALHEGVNADAVHSATPSLDPGEQRFKTLLGQSLGADAASYRGSYRIERIPGARSVKGSLSAARSWLVPFFGALRGRVQARSFQREWKFFGGPPTTGPFGPWE